MKASYKLLSELLDFPYSPEELAEKFTLTGTEVEAIEHPAEWISDIFIGEIMEVNENTPHSGLAKCVVSCGDKKYTTITGAPDIKVGIKAAFAVPGAKIFGGREIGIAEIDGEKSEGMLCSGVEVGLGFPKDRLLNIPDNAPLGADLKELLGWNDETIYEMEVTPNRPDCYGHWGLVREIAATLGKIWQPQIPKLDDIIADDGEISVKILTDKCHRYTGRLIEGIKIAPSPLWLTGRLAALGTRPIDNIVDITNYTMLLTGQPIHAFDEAKLGREIIVRQAQNGEKMFTLDDVERKLSDDVMLIASPKFPVAVAGIMGGKNSEVDENTRNIIVEVAYFDPVTVRKGSKFLGLSTESSTRFEKGTDPNAPPKVSDIVAVMAKKFAGAEKIYRTVDEYQQIIEPIKVTLTDEKVKRVIGVKIPRENCRKILVGLGFDIFSENAGGTTYEVPTFRPDVMREIDLVEEVGRIYGLWNIPAKLRAQGPLPPQIPDEIRLKRYFEDILPGLGYRYAMTDPLGKAEILNIFAEKPLVKISNPLSEDFPVMRPNPLPSIIAVAARNLNRGMRSIRLFEVENGYSDDGEYSEEMYLTIVGGGFRNPIGWDFGDDPLDLFDIKGTIEALVEKIKAKFQFEQATANFAEDGTFLKIIVDAREIGFIGTLAKKLWDKFDLRSPVHFGLLQIMPLLPFFTRTPEYKKFSHFPAIKRDVALIVDENLSAQKLLDAAKDFAPDVEKIGLFDMYRGKPIPAGEKSLGLFFIFRSAEKTLTDEDVNEMFEKIVQNLCEKFNAKIRK